MTMPDKMNVTVRLPAKLVRRVRIAAADRGVSTRAIIQESLEATLPKVSVDWHKGRQQGLIDAHEDAVEAIDDHNREEHGDDVV